MSGDNKSKKSREKVTPIRPQDSSHAGGAPAAPASDGEQSRPQTIEEAGLKLAQAIIGDVLKDAKDDEVIAKLLTTSIQRHCINQVLMQEVLQRACACEVHAQRAEGMAAHIMRRHGEPVQLPPAKQGDKPTVVFKTWYEEWRQSWERWEQRNLAAAGGSADNGKKDSKESGPQDGGSKGD